MQADGVVERYAIGGAAGATLPPNLAAVALQTSHAKDKARLLQFIETGAPDAARFQAIVARRGLVGAWRRFEKEFFSDTP